MDGYLIYGAVSVFRMYRMTPEIRNFFGWIGMTGFKWGYIGHVALPFAGSRLTR